MTPGSVYYYSASGDMSGFGDGNTYWYSYTPETYKNVFTVTLDKNGGTGGTSTIYYWLNN